jgi:hypothetical protein
MAPDLLRPLWHRLDTDPPCFFAEEFHRAFAPSHQRVLDLRLLRPAAASATARCPECGSGHVGTAHRLLDRRTGRVVVHLSCPTCGPTRVEPDELRRWAVDVPNLLSAVVAAAGGRGEPTELVPGHVWRLGHVTWCGRPRETYFVRCLHEGSRAAVTAALARHPKAALMFATEAAARKWAGPTNPTLALESIVSLGPAGLDLDPSAVEGRLAAAGLLDGPKRRPKPKRRGPRASNIERIQEALVDHIRAARDRAFVDQDLGHTPILLPRPTQQELAGLLGLGESDVSRCLNDPRAPVLRQLWEMAADLNAVMNFRGLPGAGRWVASCRRADLLQVQLGGPRFPSHGGATTSVVPPIFFFGLLQFRRGLSAVRVAWRCQTPRDRHVRRFHRPRPPPSSQ